MKHRVAALLLFVGFVVLTLLGHLVVTGCSPTAAQILVKVANESSPILLEAYRQEGLAALDSVKCDQGQDSCATLTQKALDTVDARWAPIWAAWDAFSSARDIYSTIQESGQAPDIRDLQRTYCELLAVLPVEYGAAVTVPNTIVRCP